MLENVDLESGVPLASVFTLPSPPPLLPAPPLPHENIMQIAIRGYDKNFNYFICDGKSRDIAIVDPGDLELLETKINEGGWRPKMILLTHSHHDHIGAVAPLVAKYEIPVYMHANAVGRVDVPENFVRVLAFAKVNDQTNRATFDSDFASFSRMKISLGNMEIEVINTPGHIDDAVCYYINPEQAANGTPKLITGDTLFVEGCGRADLANSNVEDLFESLQLLKALPENTIVYPGHNYGSKPISTIGEEKLKNKYLSTNDFFEFKRHRIGK